MGLLASLAAVATARASFEAQGHGVSGAVDGFTINEPFWGARGSGHAEDWYELAFDRPRSVDDVKVYFYSDKRAGGYTEPAMYTVQYLDGTQWKDVPGPVKSPVNPRANRNHVRFGEVTTTKLRVVMTHRDGHTTGLKEIQAFSTGAQVPAAENRAPYVEAWRDTTYNRSGQVRLTGIVEDDALPGRELTAQWRMTGGPDGGTVILDSPRVSTTVARFTKAGTYTLELTATDGALHSAKKMVVKAEGLSDAKVNAAPFATPTASYTSGWESVAAINDSKEPASSSDSPRWGSWPEKNTQWVQYTWDDPVRVDSSDMYFFRDAQPGAGDGVAVPASWEIEYWDGKDWRKAGAPSGYGTAEDRYNRTTFAPVTTTSVRARLTGHPQLALGVEEWKVYAETPESIREVHVPTPRGKIPQLPGEVTMVYADGFTGRSPVAWQAITEDQVAEGGTSVRITGLAERSALPVTATVWVRLTEAVEITSIAEEGIRTRAGVAPALPPAVIATYNDGSKDSRISVTWDPVDPERYAQPGSFEGGGTVAGTTHRAAATVTVTAAGGTP
jgi:hypothetical protein